MTARFTYFRRAGALALAISLAALLGCQPQEYALLLDVHARTDIRSISVEVILRDGSSAPAHVAQTVTRDAATLASDAPIRVAVSFVGPEDVIVNVRGEGPDGVTIATRCYSISGVINDTALLVELPAAADGDGDGFPAQGAVSCLDPDGAMGTRACDHACAGGVGVDCRGCIGSDCPAAPADADGHIYPGADEICADGIDQDCNGTDTACGDLDGDGYQACGVGDTGACDCADTDPGRNPNAIEVCGDGIDQNCDGVDTQCDRDGDGFPADRELGGSPDCDDTNPAIHPDVTGEPSLEVCTPEGGVPSDENCNGLIDELTECASNDLDADGAEDCALTGGAAGCDCNDCDPTVGPRAREICGNAVDENCDGADTPCLPNDADGDGEIAAAAGGTDCNDVPPGGARFGTHAFEVCGNSLDENCDGMDAPCSEDTDADGYVEPAGCEGNAAIVPYSAEICNGIDDNCDGRVDEPSPTGTDPYNACVLARPGETGCAAGRCAAQYANSFFHCGGCRQACDFLASDVCAGGTCQCTTGAVPGPECTVGDTCCPAQGCHNLQTDLAFCGNCGNDCTALYGTRVDSCATGVCSCGGGAICADGQTCCGGACVDLRVDATNCGNCGNVCSLPFASSVCAMASCAIDTCSTGRDDCDTSAPTGCETDLSLAANCGACGVGCSPNATCVASGGGFGCTCNAGYSGSGVACADINECTAGTPCGTNSACTNSVGSFSCACLTGFTSPDGHDCTDVNECTPATSCGRNLSASNVCTNTPGAYTCACAAGFLASGSGATATCIDSNECTPATACGRNLTPANLCTNTVGGYTCSCTAGFVASGSGLTATCVNVDECVGTAAQCGRTLGGGGVNVCTDTSGGYTCACGGGFIASGSGLTATCVNVNECGTVAQCGRTLGGGGVNACADTSGGYTCTCGAGFVLSGSGLTATCVNVNECMASAAQCGRTLGGGGVNACADTSGSYTCTCGAGFALSGTGLAATCVNVDECAASAAQCGRTLGGGGVNACADTSGSFTCTCGPGFVASGSGPTATCININECMATAAQCGRTLGGGVVNSCVDSSGGYTCTCGAGFVLSGSGLTATCVDVDECLVAATCGTARLNCVNNSGSYACTCDPGYTAPVNGGTCSDVDECLVAATCGTARLTCLNTPGSYTCGCNTGYSAPPTGGTCTDVNECTAGTPCGTATLTCANTVGSYICTCDAGFSAPMSGGTCTDINECLSGTPCGAGGTCMNNPGSYACTCGAATLDCGGPADCETPRSATNCGACGDICSGGTPKCCDVPMLGYTCSTNPTC